MRWNFTCSMLAFSAGIRCSNGHAAMLFCCQSDSSRVAPCKIHGCIRWTWLAKYGNIIWPQILKLLFHFFIFFSMHPTSPTAAVNHTRDVTCLRLTHHQHLCDGCNIGPLRFPAKICKVPNPLARTHCHTARPHVYTQNIIQHEWCKIQWIDIYKHMDIEYWSIEMYWSCILETRSKEIWQ